MEATFLLLVLVILAVAFTIASYIFKKGMLAFASTGSWIIAAIQSFSMSLATWDVSFSLAFLFIGLAIACVFSPLAWRETTVGNETPEDPDVADMRAEMETLNRERNQYAFLHNNKRPRKRAKW
jgi:predicted membrane protein